MHTGLGEGQAFSVGRRHPEVRHLLDICGGFIGRRGESRVNIKSLAWVDIVERSEGEISSILNKLGWN